MAQGNEVNAITWNSPIWGLAKTRPIFFEPPAVAISRAVSSYPALAITGAAISPTIDTTRVWGERERDLLMIGNFGDDWDGFGAEAPAAKLVRRADFFLALLRESVPDNPPMRVLASPDSAIAFEWANGNRLVQAEITDSDEVEWMFATPGSETKFIQQTIKYPAEVKTRGPVWQVSEVEEPVSAAAI